MKKLLVGTLCISLAFLLTSCCSHRGCCKNDISCVKMDKPAIQKLLDTCVKIQEMENANENLTWEEVVAFIKASGYKNADCLKKQYTVVATAWAANLMEENEEKIKEELKSLPEEEQAKCREELDAALKMKAKIDKETYKNVVEMKDVIKKTLKFGEYQTTNPFPKQ